MSEAVRIFIPCYCKGRKDIVERILDICLQCPWCHGTGEVEAEPCTYTMSAKESAAMRTWQLEHLAERHAGKWFPPAAGGRWTVALTPTNIGTCVVVSCACGAEKNVTDFDDW